MGGLWNLNSLQKCTALWTCGGNPASNEAGAGDAAGLASWCYSKEGRRVRSCAVEAAVKAFSLSLGWIVDISDLKAGWGQKLNLNC